MGTDMSTMTWQGEPAELAANLERGAALPDGPGDRFSGYAVMGQPFEGGDVLALRRFPVTSAGEAYTSVWHRDPDGRWTFYSDVPATDGCTRYWGPAVDHTVTAPIRLEWTGGRTLAVSVDGGRMLAWSLTLAASPMTRALNRVSRAIPSSWWRRPWLPRLVGLLARPLLGTGPMRLYGLTPTGHEFISSPLAVWTIAAARATVAGRDLGRPGRTPAQASLGEFLIPQLGLFAIGRVFMRRPDAAAGGRS
jgi:hypothetical protein